MPTIDDFDEEFYPEEYKYEKDPLEMVVRNTDIVKHLRGNGIDGMELRRILSDYHGLKLVVPIFYTEEVMKKQRKIEYAIRHISALCKTDIVSKDEKDYLCNMMKRISELYYLSEDERGKNKNYVLKCPIHPCEQGNAKTRKQAIGFQVVELSKYISKFNKMHTQKAVFKLISELLETVWKENFSYEKIKNFEKNNC